MPADPVGILGYEPADPGFWGSCQLILPGYWGTSQLRSVGLLIRRGHCSSRRVSPSLLSDECCVFSLATVCLYPLTLPLTVCISSVFTGCLVVSYFSSFFFFFFVAAVGFIAGVFLCHFGLVVLVSFP